MRATTAGQSRPMWPISTLETGGPTTWLSSAPPFRISVSPLAGSTNTASARPSQNEFAAKPALMCDGEPRPVTWGAMPTIGALAYEPSLFACGTPGEPVMSSGVPSTPSGPAFVNAAWPRRTRGSPPPASA